MGLLAFQRYATRDIAQGEELRFRYHPTTCAGRFYYDTPVMGDGASSEEARQDQVRDAAAAAAAAATPAAATPPNARAQDAIKASEDAIAGEDGDEHKSDDDMFAGLVNAGLGTNLTEEGHVLQSSTRAKQDQGAAPSGNVAAAVKDTVEYRTSPRGQKQKLCNTAKCSSLAQKYGMCKRHGGADKCITLGCTSNARARKGERGGVARKLCFKHGGKRICLEKGCETTVQARGRLCTKHGANGICSAEVCNSNVHVRGLCRKHSGYGSIF